MSGYSPDVTKVRQLMGIEDHGQRVPVIFPRNRSAPACARIHTDTPAEALTEASLRLFQDENKMIEALNQAHRLVSRVGASVAHERHIDSRAAVNEKSRVDALRLEQELSATLDGIRAASDALREVYTARRAEERARRAQARSR